MSPAAIVLGLLALVAIVAWLLGRGRSVETTPEVRSDLGPLDPSIVVLDDDDSEDEGDGSPELMAITSDGWSFVPEGQEVYLVPPSHPDAPWQRPGEEGANDGPGGRRSVFTGELLRPGELIGARVIRGAPDTDPWRLEALGRDGDYRFWAFETEEAAQAALGILEPRIVKSPIGDDGDPVPIGSDDFLLARRTYEITENELAVTPIEDEEEEPR
jgi:hypothetical protein